MQEIKIYIKINSNNNRKPKVQKEAVARKLKRDSCSQASEDIKKPLDWTWYWNET